MAPSCLGLAQSEPVLPLGPSPWEGRAASKPGGGVTSPGDPRTAPARRGPVGLGGPFTQVNGPSVIRREFKVAAAAAVEGGRACGKRSRVGEGSHTCGDLAAVTS